jgi:MoaA/NifB/PqqE/SkfB family radical SAM enzyme
LYQHLKTKKVMIWGARMTGLGALRQLVSNKINVLNFIDSDPAFKKKKVHNLNVLHPKKLSELKNKDNKDLVLLLAVSIKEEEIKQQLKKIDLNDKIEIISFTDYKSPYYTVDILGSCNLKCISCPHSIKDTNVPKGSMKLNDFKKVFDKIIFDSPDITHLSLYSWGEPFMHPYLDEIINYVHSRNIAVALSSNLSIKFKNRIEKVLKTSPDYLKISISGYYSKAYNNTHEGGDIELVKENMKFISDLINKNQYKTLVDINYHLYRDNCDENLNKIKNFADELGFIISTTYSLVMPLERTISHLEGFTDKSTEKLQENLLVTIKEGIKASSKISLPKNECPFRENQININSDLTVPVCCTVWEREGNIVSNNYLESSINQINQNKKKIDLCNKCMKYHLPEYNMGFNRKGWEKFAKEKTILDKGNI